MSRRIRNHLRGNVVGYIALFFVLTGGTAYALDGSNTVFSDDIVNGEVKTADIGGGEVQTADLGANAVTTNKILDGEVLTGDIRNGQVKNQDLGAAAVTGDKVAADAVTGGKVADGSLTGDDIANGSVGDADLAPRDAVTHPTLSTCDGTNDWTSPAAAAQPAGFWKDRSGVVHLQGSVSCAGNATEGGAIFHLPPGYLPASTNGVVRWAALAGGATIAQIAVLDDGSGAVVYDGPDDATADNYISLDGLTFRAEG